MTPGSFPETPRVATRFNPLFSQPMPCSHAATGHSQTKSRFIDTKSDTTFDSCSTGSESDSAPSPTALSASRKRPRKETGHVSVSRDDHRQSRPKTPPHTTRENGNASSHGARLLHNESKDSSSSSVTQETARSTHERLRELLGKPLVSKESPGFLYIFRDPESPEPRFKIGLTQRRYAHRIKEHRRLCEINPDVRYVSGYGIPYSDLLEKLVHADLEDCKFPRFCQNYTDTKCMSTHKEWFLVSEQMAKDTVKRWETFLRREKPYDLDGHLNIVWKYLLEERSPISPDVLNWSHEARRAQWAEILVPPTTFDYIKAYRAYAGVQLKTTYNATICLQSYIRRFFWEFSTVLYGTVTLVLCQNWLALFAFVVVLGSAIATFLSHVPPVTPKKQKKTPTKVL